MAIDTDSVDVLVDGSGDGVFLSRTFNGYLDSIRYILHGNPLAATADFTIVLERTGQGLWTEANVTAASKTVKPTVPQDDLVGAARAGSFSRIAVDNERISITIAQGGADNQGTFEIIGEGTFLPN